ncbi:mitochondrial ribosomal protein S31 [Ptiloglossa arizonensis]|uniref:mitochondrial ribosomal protein S31 n=1 Tax=Ptiloglossa arizonensis TaxID=3350558 RepID=UPI003F9FEE32
MLLIQLLSKHIRTQIVLPYKWLNVTFNIVRLSSESSSSDSSDSDSEFGDRDKQQIKKTTSDKINIRENNKEFSDLIDVLLKNKPSKNANIGINLKESKNDIENYVKKTAETLTSTVGGDKDKICSLLLNNLSNMKIASLDKKDTINQFKNKQEMLASNIIDKIKVNRYETNKTKMVEDESRQNYKPQDEQSIIHALLKDQVATNKYESRQNYKPQDEKSIIHTLLKDQVAINKHEKNKTKMVEDESRQNYKPQDEQSIIHALLKDQVATNKYESRQNYKPQDEQSIIHALLKDQVATNKYESRQNYKPQDEPSIINALLKDQVAINKHERNKAKMVEDESRQNYKPQDEPSIINALLKDQVAINKHERNKTKMVEDESRQNYKPQDEQSIIHTLLKDQVAIKKYESRQNYKPQDEPSIINALLKDQVAIKKYESRQNYKPQEEQKGESIIETLMKDRVEFNKYRRHKTKMVKDTDLDIDSLNFESQEELFISNNQHGSTENDILLSKNLENLTSTESVPVLKTWDACEAESFKFFTKHYPENAFQEMIQWTDEGKLWKFPINNEQGMEEEQNVHFSEHIFLERHLIGWCPTKGPIRHFMELVCNGLSKNPYMTVQEKFDHIMWYKEYFESNNDLLEKLGIGTIVPVNDKKQIAIE